MEVMVVAFDQGADMSNIDTGRFTTESSPIHHKPRLRLIGHVGNAVVI
jgi:hypothetical protein